MNSKRIFLGAAVLVLFSCMPVYSSAVDHAQGEMAGEPTQTPVLLQSRLTVGTSFIDGDILGATGVARFEISESLSFRDSFTTGWIRALPENDFIVRKKVENLKPNPEGVNLILKTLNVRKENAIIIGDLPSDIEAGIRAGISQKIAVVWGYGLGRDEDFEGIEVEAILRTPACFERVLLGVL